MTSAAARLHARLYVWLVRLLPSEFAAEYGADMLAAFVQRSDDARRRGRSLQLLFVLREYAGVVSVALQERANAGPADQARRSNTREAERPMTHLRTETRHAARRLARTPGFTAAAVLTLALAIGANTAIFTLLHRVVLSPLPYPSSDQLIALEHAAPGVGLPSGLGIAPGLYREYGILPSTAAIAMYTHGETTLSGDGTAEQLDAVYTTASLGDVLEVPPAFGRWFTDEETTADGARVVVLTYQVWQSRFGGSTDIIGTTLRLDGVMHEVIGIMPAGFAFPNTHVQVLLPRRLRATDRFGGFNYEGVARLRPGVSIEDARREHARVIADLPARFPADIGLMQSLVGEVGLGSLAIPLKQKLLGNTSRMLWVLLGAVLVVLLIACANLANLFLVRTDARQRDVAVRRALGAGTANIGAYYLTETLLVGLASGVVGLLLGNAAIELLVAKGPIDLPRLHEVRIDGMVVAFTAAASIVAGLGFGLMPFLRRLAPLAALLQDAGRGNTGGAGRARARELLMASQVALAVVLLVAAGLMVQSVQRLGSLDPGFQSDSRLVFRIGLPYSDYGTNDDAAAFHEQLLERLRGLPGVRQVALTTMLPLDGDGDGDPLDVRGRPLGFDDLGPVLRYRRVSTDYFSAMGIPLRRGRLLDETDADGGTVAIVVDQAAADLYFPGEDPIGRQVRKMAGDEDGDWLTVVGVVGNTPTYSLTEETPTGKAYLPLRNEVQNRVSSTHSAGYVLHANGDPLPILPGVRRALAELDPTVAMARAERLDDVLRRARAPLAFTMLLLVLAALVALLLGLIGVYAVISYAVAQRRSEIGLRLALGAQPAEVTAMIVRQSGTVILVGVLTGVVAAAGSARLLQALLFGVAWNHAMTYAVAGIGLFGVALLACWVPAKRASGSASAVQLLFR